MFRPYYLLFEGSLRYRLFSFSGYVSENSTVNEKGVSHYPAVDFEPFLEQAVDICIHNS